MQAPKPTPSSFAREPFFSVSAFKLVSADGTGTFVRYPLRPRRRRGLPRRGGPQGEGRQLPVRRPWPTRSSRAPIQIKLLAQVAQAGDVTDDNTVHWPDDREVVELGLIELDAILEDNAANQKTIIFDPSRASRVSSRLQIRSWTSARPCI